MADEVELFLPVSRLFPDDGHAGRTVTLSYDNVIELLAAIASSTGDTLTIALTDDLREAAGERPSTTNGGFCTLSNLISSDLHTPHVLNAIGLFN